MTAIASVFVEALPETSKIAPGIRDAFRAVDPIAAEAGRRWGNEIQRSIGKVTVEFEADTAKAEAQIDAVGRDRKATVEVDADTAGASIERAISSGVSQGGQAGLSALQPALMGVGITMAAGIASALSGIGGLLPAGLLGAGGVIGTLATGLDGVKEAWDDAGKAADSSGADQASKAKEVASAQRGLRDAVQSEEQAQKDVASARRDALTQLRDLNLEMRGGALDERQAILDAQAARRDLTTGRFKDSIEYQQAQLRVEEADQRVAESHQRNADLQTKASDAQAKGVDNADNVVQANLNLARTHEQVAVAQQNVNDAQTKTSSAAAQAAQSWAALAPNAQAFLTVLQGLKPVWEELQNTVQNNLFAGVGEQIQQLATTYLPMLQGFMGGMATTMSQAFGGLSQFLQQPQTMAAMQTIFANIGQSFQIWSQSIQPFAQAFLRITEVGSGFLPQLAQMVVQVANAFNQWAQSGQLGEWIQTGMTALQQLGGIIQTLLPMFGQLAPIGTATLGALQTVLTALQPAIQPLATAFAALINAAAPLLGLIGQIISQVIVAVAPAFTQWFNAMAPVVQQVANALLPVIQQLAPYLGQVAQILAGVMIQGLATLTPVLIPFVQQMGQLLIALVPLLPQLAQLAVSFIPAVQQAIVLLLPYMTQWMGYLTDLANTIVPPLAKWIGMLADTFSTSFDRISNIVTTVWNVISPIFDALKQKIDDIANGPLGKIIGFAASVGLGPAGHAVASIAGSGPGSSGGFDWDAVAAKEGVTWDNQDTGHNGHFGGLQFSPQTWAAFGGVDLTGKTNPAEATREQQIEIANRTAFTGYNGTPPQGLGAWEAITKGMVPGVTVNSQPAGPPIGAGLNSGAYVSASAATTSPSGLPILGKPAAAVPPIAVPAAVVPPAAVAPTGIDAALLANVPAGKYGRQYGDDLTKGLGDCSSAVADLVNLLDGRPTTGGDMATGTEAQWLTQHGFVQGMGGPGDFRVGFNSEHTQATLPGGTPFNWGSNAAAANRGIGGTGADDPAFTQHYYRPATGSMPAVTGPTGSPTDPYYMQYPDGYKPPGPDIGQFGQQMGSDIWSSILPDGFKNPTGFGSMKFLTGFLGGILGGNFGGGSSKGGGMPASYWANGGADMAGGGGGGGGGGGLLSGLLSGISGFTPQAFTPQSGSPGSAPGQFMPLMPSAADAAISPFGMTGQGGAAGPGNQVVNAPININNPVGQDHLTNMVNTATQAQVPRVRQGIRPLP